MDQIIRNQLRDSLWAFANASDNFSNFLELKFICFAYVMNELFSIHQLNDCWPSKQLKLIYLSFVEIWLVSQRLELWLISTEWQWRFHLTENCLWILKMFVL